MFKNVNQITLPIGLTLILVAIVLGALLPLADVTVNPQWIGFTALLGISFSLLSFQYDIAIYSGLGFLVISLIVLLFALT